jgi:pilus assembly protein CpaC
VQVNGLVIPGLRTRRASTVLELRDGEAFAIAGLMQKDFGTTVRQLPVLGSIPILGTLFRSSGFERGETELVIVVIPRLVKPVKPQQISLPTDRVKDAREGDLFLLGRSDGTVPVIAEPEKADGSAGNSAGQATKEKKANGYEY